MAHMLATFHITIKGLLCAVTFVLPFQSSMNIFQARSCEQKILNLTIWKLFYMVSFSYHFIIANLTSRADAQVHTHCYNKFRSKAESCKPCVDEALKYQPWTYGQLLSCMPSKLRMVVLLARSFVQSHIASQVVNLRDFWDLLGQCISPENQQSLLNTRSLY